MKKIILAVLILVILGTSQVTGYASYKFLRNVEHNLIEIISPRGNIILQDSLLISVRVLDNASAMLNIYKTDNEESGETLIFGPDKVNQGEKIMIYTKEMKDLSPGRYRMVFSVNDKMGESKAPVIRYFSVKNGEPEMTRFINSIPRTNITNIIESIIDRIKN